MQIGEIPQDLVERLAADRLEAAVRTEIERRAAQILENAQRWRRENWKPIIPRSWKRVACWILGNHHFGAADWNETRGTKYRCAWCGKIKWTRLRASTTGRGAARDPR